MAHPRIQWWDWVEFVSLGGMVHSIQRTMSVFGRGITSSLFLLAVSALLVGCGGDSGGEGAEVEATPEPVRTVSFVNEVAPILITHCGPCHIAEAKGDLSFANYSILMQGTLANGAVILPGFADRSSLVTLVDEGEMPKKGGPLSASEKSKLRIWVDEGAFFDGADQGFGLEGLTGMEVPVLPAE